MNLINKLKSINVSELFSQLLNGSVEDKKYQDEVHILLKAMINASKADGTIDSQEQEKIVNFMGKLTTEEQSFVEKEMMRPLDVQIFLKEIPKGMEQQVYYMSLFAIDLDVKAEKDYLDMLERELKLTKDEVRRIYDDLGVSALV